MIFWEKANIPTKISRNSVEKLIKLYGVWHNLQKNSKTSAVLKDKENLFVNNLDNLFDIAHADALNIMKVDEDKAFLQRQREPGRPGSLIGVNYSQWRKEERRRLRLLAEKNRQLKEKNRQLKEKNRTTISPNCSFSSDSSSNSVEKCQVPCPQFWKKTYCLCKKEEQKTFSHRNL